MDSLDVQIEIVGNDIEDNIDDLEAWVIVTEINLLVIDDYILSASKVPYNPQSQKFEMELTLQSAMFITPQGTLPDDSILINHKKAGQGAYHIFFSGYHTVHIQQNR